MAPALFKLLGNSKSFPCLMPRLRRDSTDNELAEGGRLVTALGLHLPLFVMSFKRCEGEKEGENKSCAV